MSNESASRGREVRVAPNIYRTPNGGWRVYVRVDGVLKPRRLKRDVSLEQVQQFVSGFKDEREKIRTERRKERGTRRAARAIGITANDPAERRRQAVRARDAALRQLRQAERVLGVTPRRRVMPHLFAHVFNEFQTYAAVGRTVRAASKRAVQARIQSVRERHQDLVARICQHARELLRKHPDWSNRSLAKEIVKKNDIDAAEATVRRVLNQKMTHRRRSRSTPPKTGGS